MGTKSMMEVVEGGTLCFGEEKKLLNCMRLEVKVGGWRRQIQV